MSLTAATVRHAATDQPAGPMGGPREERQEAGRTHGHSLGQIFMPLQFAKAVIMVAPQSGDQAYPILIPKNSICITQD